jgi:hypothetical protein
MGLGKGSSIRHLLPDEAIKITRLLCSESRQQLGCPTTNREFGRPLKNANGRAISRVAKGTDGQVLTEDTLYFALATQFLSTTETSAKQCLAQLTRNYDWTDLEFISSCQPWGYTGGTADFVVLFRKPNRRYLLVVIECKKGVGDDYAVLQTLLYVERVIQACFQLREHRSVIDVCPIVIAHKPKSKRGANQVAIPKEYRASRTYHGGARVTFTVNPVAFWTYTTSVQGRPSFDIDVSQIRFKRLDRAEHLSISWQPEEGAMGTSVEIKYHLSESWRRAREKAMSEV